MSGKARSISISKDRFMEALKLKGFNISSLSRELDKDGIITHRSLQRNLQERKMSYQVLKKICLFLDVSVSYITGKTNIKSEWLKKESKFNYDYFKKNQRIDSNGFIIPEYIHEWQETSIMQFKEQAEKGLIKYLDYLYWCRFYEENEEMINFGISKNEDVINSIKATISEEMEKHFSECRVKEWNK